MSFTEYDGATKLDIFRNSIPTGNKGGATVLKVERAKIRGAADAEYRDAEGVEGEGSEEGQRPLPRRQRILVL